MATPIEDKRKFLCRLMAEYTARAEETEAKLRENRRELIEIERELRRLNDDKDTGCKAETGKIRCL